MDKERLLNPVIERNAGSRMAYKAEDTSSTIPLNTPSLEGYDFYNGLNDDLQPNQKREVEGIIDWFSDSWKAFANTKDTSEADSIRADLVTNTNEAINSLEYRLNYVKLAKEVDRLQKEYAANPNEETAEKYRIAADRLYELEPQYTEYVNKYGDKPTGSYDDEINRLDTNLKWYYEHRDSQLKEIEELQNNVKERGVPSKQYQDIANDTDFSFTSLDSWLHKMPETLGSSFVPAQQMAESYATALATQYASKQAFKYAAFNGGPQAALAAEVASWITSAIGAGIITYNTYRQRDTESKMEVYQAYKSKVMDDMNKMNIDMYSQIAEQFEQLTGRSSDGMSSEDMLDYILSTRTDSSTEFGKILAQSKEVNKEGLDALYKQNMALGLSDIVQTSLTVLPVGKVLNKTLAPITGAVTKPIAKANKALTNYIDYSVSKPAKFMRGGKKFLKATPTGRIINKLGGGTVRVGTVAALEGQEEGVQHYLSKKFAEGEYKGDYSGFTGVLKGALDNVEANWEVGKAQLGIFGDPSLMNDEEFFQNITAGRMMGALFGGVGNTITTAKELNREIIANNKVRKAVIDQITSKDNMYKARIYVDKKLKGKEKEVLDAIDNLKYNLPEGVTTEDIDAEKARAKRIMSIANSPHMEKLMKSISRYGSEDHAILAGLIANTQDRITESTKSLSEAESKLATLYNSDENLKSYLDLIPKEKQETYKLLNDLLLSKHAIEQIKTDLSSSINSSEEGITLSDKAKEAQKKFSTYLDNKLKALNTVIENTAKTNGININEDNDLVLLNSATLEAGLTQAVNKEVSQYNLETDIVEQRRLNGTAVPNKRKKKNAKQYDESQQYIINRIDEYRKAARENGQITAQDEITFSNSENDIQVVDEVEHNHTNEIVSDNSTEQKEYTPDTEEKPIIVYTENTNRKAEDLMAEVREKFGLNEFEEKRVSLRPDEPSISTQQPTTEPTKQDTTQNQNNQTNQQDTAKPNKVEADTKNNARQSGDSSTDSSSFWDSLNDTSVDDETDISTENTTNVPSTDDNVQDNVKEEKKAYGADNKIVTKEEYEDLRRRLRDKLNQLNSGLDPEGLLLGIRMTMYHLEAGTRRFAEYANEMINDLGEAVKPYLKAFYEGARRMPEAAPYVKDMDSTSYVDSFNIDEPIVIKHADDVNNYEDNNITQQDQLKEVTESTTNIPTSVVPTENEIASNDIPEDLTEIGTKVEELGDSTTDEINTILQINPDDTQNIIEDAGTGNGDRVSHTLFVNPTSKKPMKPGYKTGKEFIEFISDPHALDDAETEIIVERYGKSNYDERHPETWDDAAIYIAITAKNGNKYIAALKTPQSIANDTRLKPRDGEIERLRTFRNKIVEKYINLKKNQKLVATAIRRTNGFFNNRKEKGKVVNRSLFDIKGLGLPDNIYAIDTNEVTIGIGTGLRGMFKILDGTGNILPGLGASGKIYIYPPAANTPSGKSNAITGKSNTAIKLNEMQFKDNRDIAEFIVELAVNLRAADEQYENTPFTVRQLLSFIVHFGNKTKVNDITNYGFLLPKQFYRNEENNGIVLGTNMYYDEDIRNNPEIREEVIKYIMDNQHFAFDKDWSFGYMNETAEGLRRWFIMNNVDVMNLGNSGIRIELADVGLVREGDKIVTDKAHPRGLSWLAWAIKNKYLTSDLDDNLFKDVFSYIEDVKVVEKPNEPTIEKKQIINDKGNTIEKPSTKKPSAFDDLNKLLGVPKLIIRGDYTVADIANELKVLKRIFGNVFVRNNVQVVNDVINVANAGTTAMGLTTRDSILLYEKAEQGTAFHEAFHRVSLLLLTPAQRNKIYTEKREKLGQPNLTNEEVEEILAEEYREYVLSDGRYEDILKGTEKVKLDLFKRMFGLNKALSTTSKININKLFKAITNGKLALSSINQTSYDNFQRLFGEDGGAPFTFNGVQFSTIPNYAAFDSIVSALEAYTFLTNNIVTSSDLNKIDFNTVYTRLKASLNDDLTDSQRNVRKEIVDNFESIFIPAIKAKLSALSIREIDKNVNENVTEIDGGNVVGDSINAHIIDSMEVSKKNNALASVKIFMSTIPNTRINAEGQLELVTDPLTGLPTFVNFDITWNTMLRDLHNCETYEEIVSTVDALGKDNAFYRTLSNRLKTNRDVNLETQIYQTVKSHIHEFIHIGYEYENTSNGRKSKFRVGDSNLRRAKRIYPALWSSRFFGDNKLFKFFTNKAQEPIQSKVKDLVTRYNQIAEDLKRNISDIKVISNAKSRLVSILNDAGIAIDDITLNDVLNNNKQYTNLNEGNALLSLLTKQGNNSLYYLFNTVINNIADNKATTVRSKFGLDKTLDNTKLFAQSPILRVFAESYAKLHPRPEETTVLGPNNAQLYEISQNCYLTDMVRWLNNDPNMLSNLSSVAYNTGKSGYGSLVLSALNEARSLGNKLNLHIKTLVNFTEEGKGDKGRDYVSITAIEDYITKMTLTRNDYLIAPTLADKKSYFVLQGIRLFHEGIKLRDNTLNFGSSTVNQFIEYAKAELYAIEHAMEIMNATDENGNKKLDPKDYPKNYFKGKHARGEGNGLRFRYFNGIYMNTTNGVEFIDFNQILDDSPNLQIGLEKVKEIFFNQSLDTQHYYINDLLYRMVANELRFAESLGLIEFNNGKANIFSLKNKLLDQTEIDNLTEKYKGSSNPDIANNAHSIAVLDMIADYAINSAVSVTEFEKLFSKDPAYHKDTDAKIKRLSAVSSTGDNLRTDWAIGHPLSGRTTFTVAALNDNMVKSSIADHLYDLFFENYKRDYIKEYLGVSEEKAIAYSKDENLAKAELDDNDYNTYLKSVSIAKDNADFNTKIYRTNDKGEGNINQADAAVYIRPQMYKDLVQMLGEWNDEVAEAFDLLTSEDTSWLSDSELYRKAIQASIKPLKMMYMGDTFLSDLGLDVPIFDKMAIFPLFKHFAYGDLADLYNKMNDPAKPIDMITFESAVKVGNRQQSDYYTDLNMESINSLDNMHVYNQEFKYLRRQLITDPHHTAEIHAGTQFVKASMSNLVTDRTYKEGTKYEITGEQLREDYFNSINELSNLGVKDILKLLGAKQNADGDYVFSSYSNLAKMLREDAINSNMPSSIIEGLDVDENGDFIIPLSALSNSSWIESRFVSLINKHAIDITTPGGAFIQMSSFGLKSKKDFSNSAVYLNDGKPLNFRNDDGSMDCIISINLFKDIIPDEIKMTDFENQRKWLMSKGIIGNNAEPCALGYRIPTQGTASISGLRIVDVLPSNIGDTIILPDEFTGLTGSDFDIDKLYIARFNFNRDGQKIEFDRSKETKGKSAYKNNSPKALQNLLLQTFMTLITDEKTVGETRMSIDTATSTLKNDILKDIEKNKPSDPYVPYKYISPRFQLSKKLEYTTGKLGIGPFALNNANHVLTQLAGLEFNTSKLLEKYNISNLSGIYGKDGKRILDWLSAMINAFVDVAKDPYIIRLNVNQYTYNMCNFLLRTGIGDSTFYFLSQDILKDVANAVNNTNGRYGIDINQSKSNRRKEAIKKVLKQYETQARLKATDSNQVAMIDQILKQSRYNIDLKLLSGNMLTRKWLRKYTNIKPENKDFNYYYDQLRIFKLFDALSVYSDALSEMVQVSQIDTKKYGNNLTLLKSFGLRINRFLNNNSVFTSASLNRYWYNGFLDVKTNNSINLAKGLFQNLVIKGTHQFSKYHNLMLNLLGISNYTNTDMSNTVANLMEANIKINFIRQYAKDNNIDIYGLFYGENNIAKRLATLKNDILSGKYPELLDASGRINNELLNILQPVFKTSYDSFDKPNSIRIVTLSADSNIIDEAGIKYFEDLLTNDNTEISQFAKDLVVYSFIASGDNRTINSLNKFIPNSIKQDMGYVDYIRKTMDELNGDSFDYNLDDVFLNNWFNDSIVPTINTKDIVSVYSSETIKTSDGRNIPYALMFKGKPTDNYNTVNNHGDIIFTPYVKIEYGLPNNPETTVVYKYVGYELTSNERFVPYYIAIDKKGVRDSQTSNLITEYGTDKSDLWYNILPNKIDISDGLSREDIITKLNDILSKTDKRKINIIGTIKQFIESVSDEGINGLNFVTTWLPWNTNLSDTELLPDEQSVDNADVVHNANELIVNKSDEELSNEATELIGDNTIIDGVDVGGRTIEDVYQSVIKKSRKGQAPYPELIEELRIKAKGKVLTDQFANTRVNQARALADILNDSSFISNNNTESTEETQEQEVEDDVFTVPFRDELGYLMEGYFDTYENFIKASSRQLVIPNTPEIQAEEKPVNTVVIGDVLFNLSKLGINFKLNEQQVNALNTIASWLKQPSTRTSNPFYTLVGYAGTGKTTIMRVLLAYIEQAMKVKNRFIKLAAPTHKAKMVLQNATGMEAMTIHQLLGLKADYNLDNYQIGDVDFNVTGSKLPINQATFIIIDEVSMVNDNLINDISVIAKDRGIKVILVGDKAQLEPVNQGGVSVAFKNPNTVELDKVERQKGSNPLLVMLDYMRGIFADGSSNFVHQSKLNENGDGVLFVDNTKDGIDILNTMVDMFSSDKFKTDLNYVKALAWTNGAVTNINNAIRKSMGYTDELNIGEPVSMYYTIEVTDDMYLYNSMDYRITDSGDATEKIDLLGIELDGKCVSLLDESANIEFKNIFVVTDKNKETEIAKAISAKLEEIYALRNTISDKELKVKLAKFWSKLNSSFLTTFPIMYNGRTIKNKGIDYSYAVTVHKSQGSTYNNVFVSEADINNNSNTRNRNQLKYVALSRASETAVVITNNDVINDYNGEHYSIDILNDRKSNITTNNNDVIDIPSSINLASDGLTTPGVVNGKTSAELLISDIDRIPSNEEIRNLRNIYNIDFNAGDRILAATERTDPAMFADDILNMLKNNRDKIKALYIITKHDGLPIKKLLQDPTPKFIHFSITGLGEKVEPGVMKPMDLLGKIEEYIKQGLNPNLITIRIDPLIPGLNIDGKTGEISNEVKKIIDKSLSMGITQFRTSMIDGYKSTVEDMASVGYNFSDYKDAYDSVNNDTWKYWSPKKSYIESAFLSLADYLTEKYIQMGIDPNSKTLHLCGEPIVFQNRPNKVNIERIGCVNTKIMMDILGLKDISAYDRSNPKDFANDRVEPLKQSTLNVKTESGMKQVTVYGKDRKNCYCAAFKNEHGQILSTKIDAAAIDQKKCMSMCAYCYMAMSKKQNNKPIRYYDEKGNLRDFNMTRTTMTNNDNIIDENRSDYDDSVMKHCKE